MTTVIQVFDGTGEIPESTLKRKSLDLHKRNLLRWVKSSFICAEWGSHRKRFVTKGCPFRFRVIKTPKAALVDEWWLDAQQQRCLFPFWNVTPDTETGKRIELHGYPAMETKFFWYPLIWYPDGRECDPNEKWEMMPLRTAFKEIR